MALLVALCGCATPTAVDPKFLPRVAEAMRAGAGKFEGAATSMLFDPEQRRLLIGREAGTVESWSIDAPAGQSTWTVQSHRVNEMALAGRPGLVFVGSQHGEPIQLRDLRTGHLLESVPGFGPTHRTPDPDVQAVANSSSLRFYDTRKRVMLAGEVPCLGGVTSIAVDLPSRRMAVGSASGSVEVWDFERRADEVVLRKVAAWQPYPVGHWVIGLHFGSDGKSLYTVTRRGAEIDLWDLGRQERLKTVRTHLKFVWSASFAPGRDVLAVAGTVDPTGMDKSHIELLSLSTPASSLYYSDDHSAQVLYMHPLQAFVALQYDSVKVLDLDPELSR